MSSDDSDGDDSSLFYHTGSEVDVHDDGLSTIGPDDAEFDGETTVMSSESLPMFKDLMRRLISINKSIKSAIKTVEEYRTSQEPGTHGREEFDENGRKLLDLTHLFSFLLSRLLRVLEDEHRQCSEVYANTLNLEDRVPFESLTHAVHHNTVFCDMLGELIDVAFDKKPAANEEMPPERRELLLAHYRQLSKTQATATYFGVLIVEGTRESFLDPVEMTDLCTVVVNDTSRRKRLIPLSLMFSMLDQDDQAVADALAANVPRVLMQRLRHLTHKLFGSKELDHRRQASRRGSPSRSPHRSSRRSSPAPTGTHTEQVSFRTPTRSPAALTDDRPPRSGGSSFPATQALPTSTAARDEESALALAHVDSSAAPRPLVAEGLAPPPKLRRLEGPRLASLEEQAGHLRLGDRVGRGPGWERDGQGAQCDSGVVVGFTQNGQVVVCWVPSADAAAAKNEEEHYFYYNYQSAPFEVVPWDAYLDRMTRTVDSEELKQVEFMQICAVAGFLCKQKDAILPTLQFQTIECVMEVFDSVDLEGTRLAAEAALKQSEERIERQLGSVASDDVERLQPVLLSWDEELRCVRKGYHDSRELVDRVGWVLNALLAHKKIALLFLEMGGLDRVMKLTAGNADTDTVYGVCVVLTHLSKTAIFEVVLRNHQHHFLPMLHFIMEQWQYNTNSDVQASAGSFLFHALSFPCVLTVFEESGGHVFAVEALEKNLKSSEEVFDVISAGSQLAILKCINVYLICQLMLSTKVIFRKHRTLSALVTRASANNALPHDAATVDAVLYYLSSSNPSLPDITAENVQSLLTPERLSSIQCLMDKGLHSTLLRCTNFYFVQGRWDILISTLQALCVLTVVPYLRPLIAETHAHDSGISQLLLIIGDLATSSRNKNSSREHHLLPCATTALQILINILMPPADSADEAAVATFNSTCGAFRGCDGIRTLLDVLQLKKDAPLSAKLYHFPVIARAVQLMVILRRFGDTALLFEALNVHRCAADLHAQYGDVQREYIAMMGPRKLHTELDPAGRFMENVKSLMPGACGDAASSEVVRAVVADDPLELEQRQAVISRAVIDYSKPSLLELVARHLESEGLPHAARVLRDEAELDSGAPDPVSSPEPKNTTHSLDEVVQTYLRQQQERCPNPIETLPQFDLTQKHIYLPPPVPLDDSRNAFNLQLYTKTNALHRSLREAVNENSFVHRYLSHVFDVAGNEGLRGECIAFCDGGDALIIGTAEGEIGIFDTFPDDTYDERLMEHHVVLENEGITSVQVSRDNTLVALVSEGNVAKVMHRGSLPIVRTEIPCSDLRFSHDCRWGLATVDDQHTCALWDLSTKVEVRSFSDTVWSGENTDNVAVFDYASQVILNDAVLWDLRSNDKPVFRFDRITESFASIFHPSNNLVILDENVWDLRTMRIVQTIPSFQKTSSFHVNPHGRIIYSFRESGGLRNNTVPIVSAVDSYSFEVIFSEETRPPFRCFALDPSDRYCAAVLDEDAMDSSIIRCFSTSAGPFLGRPNFTVTDIQEGQLGEDEDEMEMDDDDEDDDEGDWLSGDSGSLADSFDEEMYNDGDEETSDEEVSDSDVSEEGDEEDSIDEDDDEEDDFEETQEPFSDESEA